MGPTLQRHSKRGEPVWELAERFYPPQGAWTAAEYLALDTNHLIEFDHGALEFLPMPSMSHQRILQFLYRMLFAFLDARGGGWTLMVAPMPLRINADRYREPDVLYASAEHADWTGEREWTCADLVAEVVSPGHENRDRDLVEKREDYAARGVAEYWIIDPEQQQVTVLALRDGAYAEVQVATAGDTVASIAVPGFTVDAAELLSPSK